MIDAHMHIKNQKELAFVQSAAHYQVLVNCQNLEEFRAFQSLPYRSLGIHPWDSHRYDVKTLETWDQALREAQVLGEMGLDLAWTDNPIEVQEAIFKAQLALAQVLGKGVILHTKGAEGRVLELVKGYRVPVLVHWYDTLDYLDEWIALGAYFSLGVDLRVNPVVQEIARRLPLGRILLESDGLEALQWAMPDQAWVMEDLPGVLADNLAYLATIKELSIQRLEAQISENFRAFLGKKANES